VSPWLNSASYSLTMDTAETTAYGSSARSYIPSFPGGTVSLGGMFDGTSTGIDGILSTIATSQAGNGPPVALTMAEAGLTNGLRCLIANVYDTAYNVSSPVNDVVSVSADFTYSSKMGGGYILAPKTVVTASGNSTSVDYVTTTSSGGVANLHITTNDRNAGSITVRLEDSADKSSFATVTGGTFAAGNFAVLNGQNLIIPSTTAIRRYVRAAWTVTGGATGGYTVTVGAAKT